MLIFIVYIFIIIFLCIYIYIIKICVYNKISICNITNFDDVNSIIDSDIIIIIGNLTHKKINIDKYYGYNFFNILLFSKLQLSYDIVYDNLNNFLIIIKYKNFHIYIIKNNPIINNFYTNSIYICINSGHDIYKYLKNISNMIYINHNLKYNIDEQSIKIYTKY